MQTRLSTSSTAITILTAVSIGLGIVTQIVLARWFGAGTDLDAYYAASSLPNLFTLVLTSSFNIIFVPIFLFYKEKDSVRDAWEVASSFINFLVLALGAIVLFGVLFAPLILRILTPGYAPGTPNYDLTLTMFRIQWPIILFSGVNGVMAGIFYAHGRFLRPASTPVINSAAVLIFTLALRSQIGIVATAVGSLVGPILMTLWLLPLLLRNDHYKPTINWRHPGLRRVGRLGIPWIASNLFAKGTAVIDTMLTSFLMPGSLTYLNYAYRLVTMSVNLVTRGTALSIFPRISRSYAQSNPDDFRLYFSTGIRFIGLIAIPATGIIFTLREPVIRLLFEGNNFAQADTLATAQVVAIYAGTLISLSFGSIISNSFYAQHDTKTPAIIGAVGTLLRAGLAYVLLPYLSYLSLALSFTIVSYGKVLTMIYLLHHKQVSLDGKNIIFSLSKMTVSALLMSVIIFVVWPRIDTIAITKPVLLFTLIIIVGAALALYISLLFLLKSPEILYIKQTIITLRKQNNKIR